MKNKMGIWLIFIIVMFVISFSIIIYFRGTKTLKVNDNTINNKEEVIIN